MLMQEQTARRQRPLTRCAPAKFPMVCALSEAGLALCAEPLWGTQLSQKVLIVVELCSLKNVRLTKGCDHQAHGCW